MSPNNTTKTASVTVYIDTRAVWRILDEHSAEWMRTAPIPEAPFDPAEHTAVNHPPNVVFRMLDVLAAELVERRIGRATAIVLPTRCSANRTGAHATKAEAADVNTADTERREKRITRKGE